MDEYIQNFLTFQKETKNASANTLSSYRIDLKNFCSFLAESADAGEAQIDKINKTNITAYIMHLQKTGKKSSTISRNLASLRGLFQYLIRHSLITDDPTAAIRSPKVERELPFIMSMSDVELLLEQPNGTDLKSIRDKAMLEIMYATGMRVSEIICLKTNHINLSMGYVRLINVNKERVVPIGSKATQALHTYLADARDAMIRNPKETTLFVNYTGTPMTRQGFWKIIKYYAEKAHISETITPHILRHSFAAHLVSNGADIQSVQEMLGHTYIATTQIYAQVGKSKLQDVYAKAHPRA